MKNLRRIVIVLLIIITSYILVSLFLPSIVKVERSLFINTDPSIVFDQINTLKNWKKWSYWDNIDKNMHSEYSGPENGVGAKHCWESKNDSVGKGCLTISEAKQNELIITTLEFDGMGSSTGGWQLKDTANGTFVTTYMNMEMGLFGRIFPGLFMDGWLGKDFEKSLEGLKIESEKIAKETPPQTAIKVEITTTTPYILATYKTASNLQTISNDIGSSYGKIGAFMQKHKLTQAGPVMAFYHSFSPEKIELECAIPINKTATASNDVNIVDFKSSNAVVAHYYGPYTGSAAGHEAINKFINEKKLKVIGSPWEVYVTDPMLEKDTTKWLTEIFYPVE